jgi:Fur family transcriptional regulator, stress-responsive regulator
MDADVQLIAALRAGGRRVTTPRLLVHRYLRAHDRHVTAEQVFADLAEQMPSLSAATVYDTLDLLDGLGLIRRVSTPRGATTYDSRVDAHHHLVCRECGLIQDLDATVDTAAAENAARAAGFAPTFAQLTVNGLCSACRAQRRCN